MEEFLAFLSQPLHLGNLAFPFSLLGLLSQVLLPFCGFLILYKLLLWAIRRVLSLSDLDEETQNRFLGYTKFGLKTLLGITFFLLMGSLLGARLHSWLGDFVTVLNVPLFSSGNTSISLLSLILLVPIFSLSSWLGKTSQRVLNLNFLERLGLDEARRFSMGSLSRYFVMILTVLIGLSIIGVDLSALGVLLGVLGIGLGFGLQSLVANFFAGLMIISTRPIKEGDRVLVNGLDGIVQHIRFISTDIRTFQNENIIIPNSYFIDNAVHNYSYTDRRVVIVNEVGVAYKSDLEKVLAILEKINAENPYRIPGSENVVRVLGFGDSSINLSVRTLIKEVSNRADAFSWTNMAIWRVFREEGVEIPFPQRDVHIKSDGRT